MMAIVIFHSIRWSRRPAEHFATRRAKVQRDIVTGFEMHNADIMLLSACGETRTWKCPDFGDILSDINECEFVGCLSRRVRFHRERTHDETGERANALEKS